MIEQAGSPSAAAFESSAPAADSPDALVRYLHRFDRRSAAKPKIRLFLFAYAGGSVGIFRDWPSFFDERYELIGIQLPGRGARIDEAPIANHRRLVTAISDAVAPASADTAFAFYGHSMGAMLAHEVAETLVARGLPQPDYLFVSGRKAPHQSAVRYRAAATMSDADFIRELRELGGTPQEVLNNPEMMALMLPSARADFALLDDWYTSAPTAPPGPTISMPVCAMAGRRDQHCTPADIVHWQDYTHGAFEAIDYNGDHFFLHKVQSKVIGDVRARLDGVLAGA